MSRGREIYGVHEVFTPTTPARINFVQRSGLSDQLVDALNTPGMQVVVYGETGSGKSTLLQKKLEEIYTDHITSRCTSQTTSSTLLLDAFDRLDRYYVAEAGKTRDRSRKGELGIEFAKIKAAIESHVSRGVSETSKRVVPPQLTEQRLGEFLGEEELCWVIEDFHKVPVEEKRPVAETFKVFSDLARTYTRLKIIAVGATDTARQVIEYDPNMANRVSEILVPLMTVTELLKVLTQGQDLLNINLSGASADIANFSVGLAAVCHRVALNACLIKGIQETANEQVVFGSKDIDAAVKRYLADSSDTVKSMFDIALQYHGSGRFENARIILTALAEGPINGLDANELLQQISRDYPDYPKRNLTIQLKSLIGEDRDAILRRGADGKIRFAQPLYHFYAQAILDKRSSEVLGQLAGVVRDFIRGLGSRARR